MAINYGKVNEELIKIVRGLGYTIQMYDEKGSGPISDASKAKWIYLEPDGILIDMPVGNTSERDEVTVIVGQKKDMYNFLSFIQRAKVIANFYGLGFTIRNFETDRVTPKDFADNARIARDNANNEE